MEPVKLSTELPAVKIQPNRWYYAGPLRISLDAHLLGYKDSESINRIHTDGNSAFGCDVLKYAIEVVLRFASTTNLVAKGEVAVLSSIVGADFKTKLEVGQQANVFVQLVKKEGNVGTFDVQVRRADESQMLCVCARVVGKTASLTKK